MAKISLNKSALKQQRDQLKMYQRFLPSLDLKRQQLLLEFKLARDELARLEAEHEQFRAGLDEFLALLGGSSFDLTGLVRVTGVTLGRQNVVGAKLPVLEGVEFAVAEYSTLAKPHWVDHLVGLIQEAARWRLRLEVQAERVRELELASRRITQRVNLFEKVLIPRAKEHIRRITIYLADAERAAVVRSKIAKSRLQH